jgi:hypothetical protein
MTHRKQTVMFVFALAVMLALAASLQFVRDRTFAYANTDERLLYIRSGEVMKRVTLSYDSLAADVYWIRALQHYGGERGKPKGEARFDLLYPLLDLTVSLDPQFIMAYRFGAIFLSEPYPGGAGRPDLAIALLKKGIVAMPEKWDYYYDIGFVNYWNLHDYKTAAQWFERGAELPGAPWWLRTFAAVMLTRGGDRESSRFLWQQVGQSTDSFLQQTSRIRLQQLDALDAIDRLRPILDEYERRTGRRAESWQQVVEAKLIPRIPRDPTGVPFELDPETGEIIVSRSSELSPLPTEPSAAPELKQNRAGVPVPPVDRK